MATQATVSIAKLLTAGAVAGAALQAQGGGTVAAASGSQVQEQLQSTLPGPVQSKDSDSDSTWGEWWKFGDRKDEDADDDDDADDDGGGSFATARSSWGTAAWSDDGEENGTDWWSATSAVDATSDGGGSSWNQDWVAKRPAWQDWGGNWQSASDVPEWRAPSSSWEIVKWGKNNDGYGNISSTDNDIMKMEKLKHPAT